MGMKTAAATILFLIISTEIAGWSGDLEKSASATVPDISPQVRLEEIRRYIDQHGLVWEAGLTSKALLPVEDKKRLLGSRILPEQNPREIIVLPGELPESFDWRDFDGSNMMTSVKDQGLCGSCFAFGTLGAIEAAIKIGRNEELDLSE